MRALLLASSALIATALPALAVDATWLANPGSGNYNTGSNWSTGTVPTGTAFFNTSSITSLFSSSGFTTIGGWTFNAGASAYNFTTNSFFQFNGAGIVVNGGSIALTNTSVLEFLNNSTAANASITNNSFLEFANNSTAANASITNNSLLEFANNSTAANASITNNSAIEFFNTSTAGNASITSNSFIEFANTSTAANASITNNSFLEFANTSTAGNASIVNNNFLEFLDNSTAGNAAITNSGSVDFSGTSGPLGDHKISAGSIAGGGTWNLGVNELTVGGNNLSTTVSGTISGTGGSLVKTGSGTLTLSGTNIYTGGTTINGGTLQIGNGGTTGSILGNVIDNATLAFNRSNTYQYAGAISGSGAFEQDGTGTTRLTGTSNYTGATTVNAGTLQVDGALTGTSGITVMDGATLGGFGSVRDTTINNGGTLMAGSVGLPGTFTINGNLTMGASANYVVFVNPTTFGLILVNGVATLGGTMFINAANGFYHAGRYTLLTATGGLNGTTFAALNALGFGFSVRNARLAYDADDVYLLLDPGIISPQLAPNASNNQKNVAGGVDNAILGGATPTIPFSTLLGLSGVQLGNALDQVSGEASGGVAQAGMQLTTSFLTLMLNPFGGAPGGNQGALGFARGFGAGEQPLSPQAAEAYAAVTPKDRRMDTVSARWGFWGGGFGGYNKTSGDAVVGSHDTSAHTYGFAGGADYRLTPDTMVGFALAGGGTSWGLSQGLGGGRSDVFQIGLYGSKHFGAAYVSAAASYGWHDVTTDRTVTVAGTDKLDASFNAQSFGARLESGYRFMTPVVGITPYAALQVQNFRTPSYSENAVSGLGTFALSYAARSTTATRAELGAWFDKLFALDGGNALSIRTRAAWVHDHSNNPGIGAVFQTLPGSNFTVNGAAQPANSALLSAGAELRLANNVSFGGKFDGEFASGSRTYTGTGTVRFVW